MPGIPSDNHGIILFDGVCNYCSRWIDIIMRHDKKDYFRFVTLQSEFAKNILKQKNISEEKILSVILIENEKVFLKSGAGLKIFQKLGFPFSLLYSFMIVPKFIRDGVYNLIAKNRYRWFGKKEVCRVAVTEEEKRKFLA